MGICGSRNDTSTLTEYCPGQEVIVDKTKSEKNQDQFYIVYANGGSIKKLVPRLSGIDINMST